LSESCCQTILFSHYHFVFPDVLAAGRDAFCSLGDRYIATLLDLFSYLKKSIVAVSVEAKFSTITPPAHYHFVFSDVPVNEHSR
jgi:hypothetical protein